MGFDFSEVERLAANLAAAPAKVAAEGVMVVDRVTRSTARDASIFAPKRTGFLSENIEAESHGFTGRVVSLADYSEFVEDGTSDTAPQPFMRPAVEKNAGPFADDVGDAGADIL